MSADPQPAPFWDNREPKLRNSNSTTTCARRLDGILRRETCVVPELAGDPPREEDCRGGDEEDAVKQPREDVEIGQGVEERSRRGGRRGRQRDERGEKVDRLRREGSA